MKTRYFLLLAATVLLASCQKEFQTPEIVISKGVTTLEVGLPDTKTYLGDAVEGVHKVYWSNGDQIAWNGTASEELTGLDENAASATFTFPGVLSAPMDLLYPASIYTDESHVTLPSVQAYNANGFAPGMFPMAGHSESAVGGIRLSHLCALVKISIKRAASNPDTDNIIAVRVKGRNNEQVSGNIAITYNPAALAAEDGASAAEKEVKVIQNKATSTSTAVDYFVVIPARTYANGIDVIVQDVNGHIMTKSKTSSWTPVAGHQYNMPEFEFVPTGTELGIEISNAAQLIAFAEAYNAKEYDALGDALVVSLTADFAFDASSSAEYETTGGIGNVILEETNYFHGVFDGKNHTISGYTGSVPLFAYCGSTGKIMNIILGADCDKTIDAGDEGTLFGAFVGYHKGLLQNCVSHADLTFSNIGTSGHFYGGLVGRNHGGIISNCTMDGDVVCPATSVSIASAANQAGIGGIAGRSNGASSQIKNSHFNGNITVSDGSTYGGITGVKGVNFLVGGIVGHLQEGSVTGCDTYAGKTMDIRGTFNAYIGGIAGWAEQAKPSTISDCANNMTVSLASEGGRTVITPTALAGIIGHGTGVTISNCVNNGAVSSTCNANLLYAGGIAAMGDDSSFEGCRNTANITHTNQITDGNAARYLNMGGIVGIFTQASTKASTINSCRNSGMILSNQLGTSGNTTVDMGGIVGKTDGPSITITNCKNLKDGVIQVIDKANKVAFARTALGGILGYSHIANTVLRGSYNSARVYCQYTQGGTSNRPTYVGGIVGFLGTADKNGCTGLAGLEVDNCHNTGNVWNQNYNNTVTLEGGPFQGGIIGAVVGESANKASIHDCTSATPAADSTLTCLRGISGGIAGYAKYATIEGNSSSMIITGNNNATGAGGLVGWTVNSSLSNCSFTGQINASSNSAPKNVGGLVYLMDGGSSIASCSVDDAVLVKGSNATATSPAVLVSSAESGATITGCGVKGTIEGEPITLVSNMITTDAGATVSGTYLIP